MKKHGLVAQFIRLLAAAGFCCVLLYFALQSVTKAALLYYNDHSDIQQRSIEWKVESFQRYITSRELTSREVQNLDDWVSHQGFLLINVYQGRRLIYSNFNFSGNRIGARQVTRSEAEPWEKTYAVRFADAPAEVQIFCSPVLNWWMFLSKILVLFCVGVFLFIFWLGCRRIVDYICLLSEEIQAMEGGDLTHLITIWGSDELTTLAGCLDSMRVTLRQQQEEEARASAKVKNLITEMSHDLRTPLTTLLLYTEIVRSGKYQDEEQRNDYLNKIDTKARQIKQLSDNLFEYALVTRDTVITLDPPACFSHIFEEPLAEMVDTLQQRGFACVLDLGSEDLMLTVKMQYIRRILDNITSNALKYADPAREIAITFVREENRVGLAFANAILPDRHAEESTRVGLTSIETMMEKMDAICRVEEDGQRFCITLLFPLS